MKKIVLLIFAAAFFFGCSSPYRLQMTKPAPLAEKDVKNAEKISQIIGNKQESVLILDAVSLEFALQYPEYFAESAGMWGFKTVAVPFAESRDADMKTARGKEMNDFVMLLNSKGLRVFYLLKESDYINRKRGNRFVWGKGNPYRQTLLNLKEFWRELPDSAEMPTVIIALEMNRWNDKNVNRPSGLLFTWRKEKDKKGDSNDRMFCKSMQFFDESRKILDLEQLILMLDDEVVFAGEKGSLTDGSIKQLLHKADALAIRFEPVSAPVAIQQKLQMLAPGFERGSIFVVTSPGNRAIDSYTEWLGVFRNWNSGAWKFECCAGVWMQDWMKLNRIWRIEK